MSSRADPPTRLTRRKAFGFLGAVVAALILAVAAQIGTDFGSKIGNLFEGDDEPISYSAEEQALECGTAFFIAGKRAMAIASGKLPSTERWPIFRESHNAVAAAPGVVDVSIQGESSRTIVLTRIEFTVERRDRPVGAVFSNPCGDAIIGRQIQVDVDVTPPVVVASAEANDAIIGARDSSGRRYKPIVFPWTVSITDPLELQIVARSDRCYCAWRAAIPWRSGSQRGTITIDNEGDGYPVVGVHGLRHYLRDSSLDAGWRRWK